VVLFLVRTCAFPSHTTFLASLLFFSATFSTPSTRLSRGPACPQSPSGQTGFPGRDVAHHVESWMLGAPVRHSTTSQQCTIPFASAGKGVAKAFPAPRITGQSFRRHTMSRTSLTSTNLSPFADNANIISSHESSAHNPDPYLAGNSATLSNPQES
jgi:hypothetical protein